MKSPLARYYLEAVEDKVERVARDTNDKSYTIESYKEKFKKNTGYDFDELKNGSLLKAVYLRKKNARMILRNAGTMMDQFFEEQKKYYDDKHKLNEPKAKEAIKFVNDNFAKEFGSIEQYIKEQFFNEKTHEREFNKELTNVFEELTTLQNKVYVLVNPKDKNVYISLLEYTFDYYNVMDMLSRGKKELFLFEKRFWPKDPDIQKQMNEAKKKLLQRKKSVQSQGKVLYAYDYADEMPYRYGSDEWIEYFFKKLDKETFDKYKDYKFCVDYFLVSGITTISQYSRMNEFENKKVKWSDNE